MSRLGGRGGIPLEASFFLLLFEFVDVFLLFFILDFFLIFLIVVFCFLFLFLCDALSLFFRKKSFFRFLKCFCCFLCACFCVFFIFSLLRLKCVSFHFIFCQF